MYWFMLVVMKKDVLVNMYSISSLCVVCENGILGMVGVVYVVFDVSVLFCVLCFNVFVNFGSKF